MNEVTLMTSALATADFEGVTAREFMRMIEEDIFDGVNAELIEGVIHKVAPSHIDHATLNAGVTVSLARALENAPVRFAVDLAIETNSRTLLGIDIAAVNGAAPSTGAVRGNHVELAVEIASTTLTKDLVYKAAQYAMVGIAQYWVVDVKARVVHVMTIPQSNGYAERAVVRFGEPLRVPRTDKTIIIG